MIHESLGYRVKEIRISQKMSQARLAELSGIIREQISKIENGQVNMTIDSIYKISLALDISLVELFNYDINIDYEKYLAERQSYKMKPFVKWAGGKTKVIPEILPLLPNKFNAYFEPFVGGGALLLHIRPFNAVINDFNHELVSAYKSFSDGKKYKKLIEFITRLENTHTEEKYYKIRDLDRTEEYKGLTQEEKAARFIYLNKACFNGLYRVNSTGYFNVPSGKKKMVKAYEKENFEALHKYFSQNSIKVLNTDFERAVKTAKRGDFVYFDPPYDPFEDKNSFTAYQKSDFTKADQLRLAKLFEKLTEKGVNCMLSNHNTEYIRELYKNFNIHIIYVKRMINAKGDGRGAVEEVIITNYPEGKTNEKSK